MKPVKIKDFDSAVGYLEGLINLERRPEMSFELMGLGRIRALLRRMGNPEKGLSIIHVAGSKGKGSTCLFAESALSAVGIPTGVFTSPHLERWTERFRIAGRDAATAELTRAVARLQPQVDWLFENDPANGPTFFDATTAAALSLFAEAGLTHAILEVGLGGRLDSTNAVTPRVTCITSIEFEHVDELGDTLAAIAGEKAGILKPGVPCFIGELPSEAEEVVRRRARELEVRVYKIGVDFERLGAGDVCVLGRHQLDNASIALAAARVIADAEDEVGKVDADFERCARRAIALTRLPGRIEVLAEDPLTIVDGAHTRASALSLAAILPISVEGASRLLLSVSGRKDLQSILDALIPHFSEITVTCADLHRSLAAPELAEAIRGNWPDLLLTVTPDPQAAAIEIQSMSEPGDLLCAAGSIYMAGIARRVWLANSGESTLILH
jgi:dihydrofolate synthase/folylpolyglutamate synthase